jgi:hypothetical protein
VEDLNLFGAKFARGSCSGGSELEITTKLAYLLVLDEMQKTVFYDYRIVFFCHKILKSSVKTKTALTQMENKGKKRKPVFTTVAMANFLENFLCLAS